MWKFGNLRSLYLHGRSYCVDVLPKIFKTSINIRLLYLCLSHSEGIPKEIGHLIHLRYLKICNVNNPLPRPLSNLYHMQFLSCHSNGSYYRFPREINDLPKISYLKLPGPGIQEIGKLISLQELDGFYVKNEVGFKIGELEYMNELRLLRVNCLENVQDAKEACNAKLCNKRNLTDLSLVWRDSREWNTYNSSDEQVALDEEVLDNLQPHNKIKKLKIYSYEGARSGIWMNNINIISNLEYIDLKKCLKWQILPSFGQLPFLKSLYLSKMPNVKWFDNKVGGNDKHCVFPSLQVLHITDLPELEDWFDARVTANDSLFPCLTELYLENCPKMRELPSLPPKLEKLEINYTRWEGCNWLQGTGKSCSILIRNLPDLHDLIGLQEVEPGGNCQLILSELQIKDPSMLLMEPLRRITSLQSLKIMRNEKLVSFSNEEELWFMQLRSSLCELEFAYLESLKFLPSSLESLSSLKILRIEKIPRLHLLTNFPASLERLHLLNLKSLQQIVDIPTSLKRLVLQNIDSLQCLPSLSLSSLKDLTLIKIPLQKLPDLPLSLCELCLFHSSKLDCMPCLSSLSSLQILTINYAPRLRELPDLPPSLKSLLITGCHPELMDCYQRDTGSYWHKISQIPDVIIY